MKNYIKPEFVLASLGITALAGTNCSIQKEDRELLEEVLEIEGAFAATESCELPLTENDLGGSYCKFTSGELGAAQAFFS